MKFLELLNQLSTLNKLLGLAGSIASIIALALVFLPNQSSPKDPEREENSKHISATAFLLDENYIRIIKEKNNIRFKIDRIERRDDDDYSYEDYVYTMAILKDFRLDESGMCHIEVSAKIINKLNGEICDKKDNARVIQDPNLWKNDESVKEIIKIAERNYELTDGSYLLTDRWAFDAKCYNNEQYEFLLEFYDKKDGKYAEIVFPIDLMSGSTRK